MKRLYVVTMPDGSRWGVPAEIIADNRAKYYSKIDPHTTYQDEYDTMMYWFDSKNYEFADWAKDNMDWDDVKQHAIRMPDKKEIKIDWQEGWVNGEYEYVVLEEDSQ